MQIGIIGGAGPDAGILMMQKIIGKIQRFGLHQDFEFPKIHLVNVPFPDMLKPDLTEKEKNALHCMLMYELGSLHGLGCDNVIVACQTLHPFIGEMAYNSEVKIWSLLDVIHWDIKTKIFLSDNTCGDELKIKKINILASPYSAESKIHADYMSSIPYEYLDPDICQRQINMLLRGSRKILPDFQALVNDIPKDEAILFGCTEFSLILDYFQRRPMEDWRIIDPIENLSTTLALAFVASNKHDNI